MDGEIQVQAFITRENNNFFKKISSIGYSKKKDDETLHKKHGLQPLRNSGKAGA